MLEGRAGVQGWVGGWVGKPGQGVGGKKGSAARERHKASMDILGRRRREGKGVRTARGRASSMVEMGAPEFVDKLTKGPVVILTVLPECLGRGPRARWRRK